MSGECLSVAFALALLVPASLRAQGFEVSASIGYGASEGVSSDDRQLVGAVYDTLDVESGASFNVTAGYLFNERLGLEFLWARQSSRFTAEGPAGSVNVSDLAVYNYMANLVYTWGLRETRVRPYVFGGIGATQYSFGDLDITPPSADRGPGRIDGETRFAGTVGAGLKVYVAPRIGLKAGVRFTPTYIGSTPEGIWCDPFYGCWPISSAEYSNQFETAVGLTVRF